MYVYTKQFYIKLNFAVVVIFYIGMFYKLPGPDYLFVESFNFSGYKKAYKSVQTHVWFDHFL